ncbi:MAG: RteC domain-containing protein [Bacteroidota bacterium]|nr:RteC domain-containing protein [Bacteroidota bacterium]
MKIEKFASVLYDEMEKKIAEVYAFYTENLKRSKDSSIIILQYLSKLKEFTMAYEFASVEEEIIFFKILKPKFLSKLIYHQKVFNILTHLPLSTIGDIKVYYVTQLSKINDYYKFNDEFVMYYRSQATAFDEVYFLRKEPDSWLLLSVEGYETDMNFTTIYDHKISKIIAFELLSAFITTALAKLEIHLDLEGGLNSNTQKDISWTSSKVALVELLYALQSAGACNNGNMDLKRLADHLEIVFNVDLGNYYRVFQEMRIRKINRTTFLDQLKERLIQRMDEADENPKFK